jgi:phenylpyruvate tautomerase PptA (4-oxalocrotonate tautomerase family)
MPLLKIQTNQSLHENHNTSLVNEASEEVARLLGKPERYVMVSLQSNPLMRFAGTDAPLAYLELKSIGLPESATQSLSEALCDLVHQHLGVDRDRIYIEFTDAPRAMWGWNGTTF